MAQIVVAPDGNLALANERARQMFRLMPRDNGRVLQDLEVSYRPVELRSRIEQSYAERRTVDIKDVLWTGINGNEQLFLDVQVVRQTDGAR
ncbi:MAG: chemotaxis protein CheR, partial [Sphingobacteriales bacterium]